MPKKEQLRNLQRDYREVFGTPAGNRVFFDLLNQTYIFHPFEQQNASAYAKEGKRELGLYLLGCVGFSDDSDGLTRLILMLKAKGEDHGRR